MLKFIVTFCLCTVLVGCAVFYFDLHKQIAFYLKPVTPLPTNAAVDSTLVGKYYIGDGLGFNQHLTLHGNGQFECSWSGCLGTYGATSGNWGRHGTTLFISTTSADGLFLNSPLKDMSIVNLNGVPHFLSLEQAFMHNNVGKLEDDAIVTLSFSPR